MILEFERFLNSGGIAKNACNVRLTNVFISAARDAFNALYMSRHLGVKSYNVCRGTWVLKVTMFVKALGC